MMSRFRDWGFANPYLTSSLFNIQLEALQTSRIRPSRPSGAQVVWPKQTGNFLVTEKEEQQQ